MRIGITGHSNLTADTTPLVADAIKSALADAEDLVGVTCLAQGADQVFARVVLGLGGRVEVVLPSADYRDRVVSPDNAAEFDALIRQADTVRVLPYAQAGEEAYMAASEQVLSTVLAVIAVWDGGPAGGHGGTADVVAAARERGLPVTVLWPDGARRQG
ncbi:hypothetical protein ACTG9Q_06730 [Actinokineospora sp. 24-640]